MTGTNFVRTPRVEGSAPGVVGAGGHAPPHGWQGAPEGLAVEVVATGEETGLPFLGLRFAGIAGANGHCCIQPEPGKAAAARQGREWTVSGEFRHVGGGFDGVESVNL